MLTRKRKDVIPCKLTIISQGDKLTFGVVFKNLKSDEFLALMPDDKEWNVPDVILQIVDSWDSEYPLTVDGLKELENDRAGFMLAIIESFHKARGAERVKN